jgi:hypothetical protein
MRAAKFLRKLETEADLAFEKQREVQRLEFIRLKTKQPPSKAEQSRDRLFRLRKETAEILNGLELARQVETENARYLEARLEQRKANLTPAEKKAQAEEARRFQIYLSQTHSPEHHPDWRTQENLNAEIYRLQYTPTHGSKPKTG